MKVARGPKIEGTLADPLWEKAPPLKLHPVPGQDGRLATTCRLLFDATHLYAAIACEEPDAQLQAKARERDGDVWADDCVELYILPHPEVGYKQIGINALGTLFDQTFPPGGRGDRAWNARVKAAVSAEPGKGWKAALAVPLSDLGARTGGDQTWRFNVTRLRKARGAVAQQEYTWCDLPTEDFHRPDSFGLIERVSYLPEGEAAARPSREFRGGLEWSRLQDVRGVRRCFPHPLDPLVAWCATDRGLLVTRDEGHTWAPVEGGVSPRRGSRDGDVPPTMRWDTEVTCLAVATARPDTLCLGTDAKGLFLSTDGGTTWKPLGTPHSSLDSLASPHIEWVDFCPSDPTRRTLLATHGLAAPGLSLSRDLGATWEVLGKDRYLGRFVKQGETIVAIGSMVATEGKAWGLHRSGTDGVHWEETLRGVRPSAVATPGSPWQFFACTAAGAILQADDDGRTWREVAQAEGAVWASLFFTNGPTDRAETLAAYDPQRQGLCLSRHRFSNGLGERHNQGLYVGPFVKSGASCVANANGTAYYIAMNNALWVGRWALPTKGPAIAQARTVPCSVQLGSIEAARARGELHGRIATLTADEAPEPHLRPIVAAARTIENAQAEMQFTLHARVQHPRGPRALKSVTVDAAKLGGSDATPLLADGQDGAGLFAATLRVSPAVGSHLHFAHGGNVPNEDVTPKRFRDTCLLTVKATDDAGASETWPAVVHLARGPVALALRQGSHDSHDATGPVTVQWAGNEGVYPKAAALRFAATGPGPWRAYWVVSGDGSNGAGLAWLTFHIKGDVSQELFVHLMDHHRVGDDLLYDEPHYSRGVPLLAGGYLKAITPAYQRVRIPIEKLLPKGTYFLRWHTAGLGLSAPEGSRPGTCHVDLIQVEP